MRFAYLLLLLTVFALPVEAHESGESFESVIDGYTVDIGYTTAEPATDDVVAFDFQLEKEGKVVPFSDVWVRIEDAQKVVVFAGGIHNSQYGGARMSYRFPEAGSYTMSVRYEQGEVALAQVSVPMTVTGAAATDASTNAMVIGTILALVVGAGVFAWYRRPRVSP